MLNPCFCKQCSRIPKFDNAANADAPLLFAVTSNVYSFPCRSHVSPVSRSLSLPLMNPVAGRHRHTWLSPFPPQVKRTPTMSRATATKAIDVVCTMATEECRQELFLFLRSLRTFHPELPLVVGCSRTLLTPSTPAPSVWESTLLNDARIRWIPCLDQYGAINRSEMERTRGVWFPSRHADFMMEKANLLEYAMTTAVTPRATTKVMAAFVDCDVCFLAPLPSIPEGASLVVSPHGILPDHEKLFGRYNGGFVAMQETQMIVDWRAATRHSRFFDQASLETLAEAYSDRCYHLPPSHNYGFWRLLQTAESGGIAAEASKFSIACHDKLAGAPSILYNGTPLASLHTHFFLPPEKARDVTLFNRLMKKWVRECVDSGNQLYSEALAPLLCD